MTSAQLQADHAVTTKDQRAVGHVTNVQKQVTIVVLVPADLARAALHRVDQVLVVQQAVMVRLAVHVVMMTGQLAVGLAMIVQKQVMIAVLQVHVLAHLLVVAVHLVIVHIQIVRVVIAMIALVAVDQIAPVAALLATVTSVQPVTFLKSV